MIDAKVKPLAKQIVDSSLANGLVDESRLLHFVQILSSSEESIAQDLLAEVDRLVGKIEKESTLIVESAFAVDQELLAQVKGYFEKREGRNLNLVFSLNKELLGGIRIKLGDFVWEKTVLSNLESVKEAISL